MMNDLMLVAPGMDYEREILAYKAETLAVEPHMNGVGGLQAYDSVADWLDFLASKSRRETCPDGLVPETTCLCVRRADNRVVGMVSIRHELNDFLLNYGGHIGYSIRPDERGKGYAKRQLRLTLDKCRALGLERVLITCDETNERSRCTIESCGGRYEDSRADGQGVFKRRYWFDT